MEATEYHLESKRTIRRLSWVAKEAIIIFQSGIASRAAFPDSASRRAVGSGQSEAEASNQSWQLTYSMEEGNSTLMFATVQI